MIKIIYFRADLTYISAETSFGVQHALYPGDASVTASLRSSNASSRVLGDSTLLDLSSELGDPAELARQREAYDQEMTRRYVLRK